MIGRRAIVGAIGAAALLPTAVRAQSADVEAAARREGAVTWYTAHTDGETAETVGRAFTARYPGIRVTVICTTAQVAYQRLLQDLKNRVPNCDVFSTTDLGHDEALKAQGHLARLAPA